eukprot:COSAG05_NODE_538_length_8854_cov_306.308738_20_plen_62_part_01
MTLPILMCGHKCVQVRGLGVEGEGSKGVLTRLPELELGESDEENLSDVRAHASCTNLHLPTP